MQYTAGSNGPHRLARGRDDRAHHLEEPSIRDLLRQLTTDSTLLVKQQFELAKTELKESTTRLGELGTQIGIALALALPGVLALGAFLVIGLGELMDSYWASALIVGIVLCAAAALTVKHALDTGRSGDIGLDHTQDTLRDDARWAKTEIRAFKREITA